MDDFRIVVVGHVDHGKSTIIGRLLFDTGSLPQHVADKFERVGTSDETAAFAFVTDQLSEEQEGSFTLDTAQAYFRTAKRDSAALATAWESTSPTVCAATFSHSCTWEEVIRQCSPCTGPGLLDKWAA